MDGEEDTQAGLDPIALTLALWLGVIVGVTGFVRMSENAAARTAQAQAAGELAGAGGGKTTEPSPLFNPRLMAFGG